MYESDFTTVYDEGNKGGDPESDETNIIDEITLGKLVKDSMMMGKNYIKGKKLKLDMNLRSHMKFLELLRERPENSRRLSNIEQVSLKNIRRGIKEDVRSFLEHSFPLKVDKFCFNTGSITAEHVKIEPYVEIKGDEVYGPLIKCFFRTRNEVVMSALEFDTYALGKIFKSNSNNKKLSIFNCKIVEQEDDEDDDDEIYISEEGLEYVIKQIDFTGTGDILNSDWAEKPKIIEKLIEAIGDEPSLVAGLKKISFKDCGLAPDRFKQLLDENDLGHVVIQDYVYENEESKEGEDSPSKQNKDNSARNSLRPPTKGESQVSISFDESKDESDSRSNNSKQDVMEISVWKDL